LLQAVGAKGWRIAAAESCTGGMISAALTDLPGSSQMFEAGFITYSNAAKTTVLGVRAETLAAFGAVSEDVAKEMAQGAQHLSGAQIAVAVTGIAGPGGSEFKPEGRVCFAIAQKQGAPWSETIEFGAIGRDAVRQSTCDHALALLLRHVMAG
jgi:nicotinamide-nucleotide amidase